MTIQQTRQLGIEFERRILALSPQEEFEHKLDTLTIYSYLNEFQTLYVTGLYNTLEQAEADNKSIAQVEQILQSLIKVVRYNLTEETLNNLEPFDYTLELPKNFYKYIQSSVENSNNDVVSTKYAKFSDILKIVDHERDSLRIIRKPLVTLLRPFPVHSSYMDDAKKNSIGLYTDHHNVFDYLMLYYYSKPAYFDIMASVPCELPISCFDDLVNGAVQLYILHATANNQKESKSKNNDEQ